MSRPILCLDFDGVLHSYTSGWKGASVIQDPPVPGALEFIVEARKHFSVAVFSSRSHQWGGRRAMKRWLHRHLCEAAVTFDSTPPWLLSEIHAFADPWPDQVEWDMKRIVSDIRFPLFKPPAMVSIDDRCLTFDGTWPPIGDLRSFKPWNKSRRTT